MLSKPTLAVRLLYLAQARIVLLSVTWHEDQLKVCLGGFLSVRERGWITEMRLQAVTAWREGVHGGEAVGG